MGPTLKLQQRFRKISIQIEIMNQRFITFIVRFGCSDFRIPYVKDSTELRNCKAELRLLHIAKDVPGSSISSGTTFRNKLFLSKTYFP